MSVASPTEVTVDSDDIKEEKVVDDGDEKTETSEIVGDVDASPDGGIIQFNVVNYNCFLFPVPWQNTAQKERLELIPTKVSQINGGNVDLFCFSEVWGLPPTHTHSLLLAERMKKLGWKFTTGVLKREASVSGAAAEIEGKSLHVLDGGLLMCSKHKIVSTKSYIYPTKATKKNQDTFAAKGLWYARVKKHKMHFNVFGTHLQSGKKGIREEEKMRQVSLLGKFIRKQKIPSTEPIIICGDLNIRKDSDDYNDLVRELDVGLPTIIGELSTVTGDSTISCKTAKEASELTSRTESPSSTISSETSTDLAYPSPYPGCKFLDYIFYSNQHMKPSKCTMESQRKAVTLGPSEVIVVKRWHIIISDTFENRIIDLSDHLPILGCFEFEYPTETEDGESASTVVDRSSKK